MLKLALVVLGVSVAVGAFVYSGVYDMGADNPHWAFTHFLIATARDRSIARHAKDIEVPDDLGAAERIRRGAGNYDAMCAGCHLKPGKTDSEIRRGLYPEPPNFAAGTARVGAAAAPTEFWVIKHGIKGSGMPAWGRGGVDDATIWDMVALIRTLPTLTPDDYRNLVRSSAGHTHSGAEPHHHDD